MTACSRWWSECREAAERYHRSPGPPRSLGSCIPEGCQPGRHAPRWRVFFISRCLLASLRDAGAGWRWVVLVRWCRYAQPPATGWHASGIQIHPTRGPAAFVAALSNRTRAGWAAMAFKAGSMAKATARPPSPRRADDFHQTTGCGERVGERGEGKTRCSILSLPLTRPLPGADRGAVTCTAGERSFTRRHLWLLHPMEVEAG